MSDFIIPNFDFNISEIMISMVKEYATEENYHNLIFRMSPDFFRKLKKQNSDVVVTDNKDPVKRFMGIEIKVIDGTEYLTLSCDRI